MYGEEGKVGNIKRLSYRIAAEDPIDFKSSFWQMTGLIVH